MMYATKIRMQYGCTHSNTLEEIADIFLEGCDNPGFFSKETLHDYLKKNPESIKVKLSPFPYLIPATSSKAEKYVRSAPNQSDTDNLLNLPRV